MVRTVRRFLLHMLPNPLQQVMWRGLMWYGLLRGVKGETFVDTLTLWVAAVVDTLRRLQTWKPPRNAYGIFPANVRSDGFSFSLRPWSDDVYFVHAEREAAVVSLIRGVLKPGDVFVDGGCNIGIYSLIGGRLVGDTGTVIGVDANPENLELLKGHALRNKITNIRLHCGALFRADNETLKVFYDRGQFGMASIAPPHQRSEEFSVQSITLDTICKDVQHIKLMKLDIEEAEYDALMGASKTLSRTEMIVFECSPNAPLDKITELLQSHAFEVQHLQGINYLASRPEYSGRGRTTGHSAFTKGALASH